MSNLLERSILMTLGAAAITKEVADSIASGLTQKGEETTELGRQAVQEAVEKAQEETRSLRVRFDNTLQRNFRELGLAANSEVEELKLKVAQLEHRISLLEAISEKAAAAAEETAAAAIAVEGVIGEAVSKEPDTGKKSKTAGRSKAAGSSPSKKAAKG